MLLFCLLAFAVGCKKSPGPDQTGSGAQTNAAVAAPAPTSSSDTIARLHWLGKKRLAAETNAAAFMSIWNLPESGAVETQFLDKWAVALGSGYWFGIPSPELKAAVEKAGRPAGLSAEASAKAEALAKAGTNSPAATSQATNLAPVPAATLSPSDGERAGLPAEALAKAGVRGTNSTLLAYESLMTNYQQTVIAGSPALMRPLLNDLVQEESYLEVRQPTNQPAELVLAIKLDDDRAALWQKNLAAALEALTGAKPVSSPDGKGWKLGGPPAGLSAVASAKAEGRKSEVEFSRSGSWTLIGWSGKADRIPLLDELADRIKTSPGGTPFLASATNFWVDAYLDLRRLSDALSFNWHLPEQSPRIDLTLIGDGTNVVTRAQLSFPQPLLLEIEPWNIPTNLIHGPLLSFTAIRGTSNLLSSIGFLDRLLPNQLYFWSQSAAPVLTYSAMRIPNASNTVVEFSDYLFKTINPLLLSNAAGRLEWSPSFTGMVWEGVPFAAPFVQAVSGGYTDLVYIGFSQSNFTNTPPPAPVLRDLERGPNLLGYSREMTGSQTAAWLYVGQLLRLVFHRGQLPTDAPSVRWLNQVGRTLGSSETSVTKADSSELMFHRTSTLGLCALELQFLADWVESPTFPNGLNTLATTTPVLPLVHGQTNRSAAPDQAPK